MKERYSQSGFGQRDLEKPNHWSDEMCSFKITKPTYINLPGNGSINSRTANGRAARSERLMGLKPKETNLYSTYNDIDIISFYYGRDNKEDTVGYCTKEEVSKFVNQLFLPLCVDIETDHPLPIEVACKNFSMLIFDSHCYGSQVLNDFMGDLKKKLLIRGFSTEDTNEIFSHSFHYSYSPLQSDSYLPFMQVNSLADKSFNVKDKMALWFKNKYGHELNGIEIKNGKKLIYSNSKNKYACESEISLYTSQLVNIQSDTILDEHSSIYVDLDDNWNTCSRANGAKNSECVSKISGLVLAMAGARALNIHSGAKAKPVNLNKIFNSCNNVLQGYKKEDLETTR